jgi:hypothetical protein
MRIDELEKRMDYKFEERMRRIEAVEGSSVRKVRITTNFYTEYGSTMLVSEITNTIYVDNGNSCPGSETWQSPYCSIQGALNAAAPGTGGSRKIASAPPLAYLPLSCTFLKRPTQGNSSPKCFRCKPMKVVAREPPGPGGHAPNSELERLHQIPDIPCQQGCCGDLRSAEYRTTPSKQSEPPTGSLRMTPATARSTSRPKAGVGPHGIRGSEAGRCPGKIGRGG